MEVLCFISSPNGPAIQKSKIEENPSITMVLVRGKEVPITHATLYTFWWTDGLIPKGNSAYHKASIENQYAWVAEVIAVGSPKWARDGRKIKRQDILPETKVWFDFVRRSLMPSRNTVHVSIEAVVWSLASWQEKNYLYMKSWLRKGNERLSNLRDLYPTRQWSHVYV